jgi:carboxyl-terminal processing protease
LISDLRFNGGGLLDSAINITNKFIEEGLIVSTQPKWQMGTYAQAKKKGTHPDYPLVVLINKYSASASEIVSGALQDPQHKRAILVGERTHGKGSVQGISQYPSNGAQLKYTMSYYYLPSGQKVKSKEEQKKLGRDDWGIGPDMKIELTMDEIKNINDVQRDNSILVKADHDNGEKPLERHNAEQVIGSDPQLAAAVLIIKGKLLQTNGSCVAAAEGK